ncbi:MAG: hypothetical protein ABUS57_16145 [Pseudomonadota bacterium]
MRKLILALSCALAASCQTTKPAPLPSYELTDLTGAYTAFFDETQGMPRDERVAAFKARMDPFFPGFYDPQRMEGLPPERYDGLIATSFDEFPERRAAYTRTAAEFQDMLRPALASFTQTFSDFHQIGHIYLLHSVGEMDGGVREVRGHNYLIFGADVMARIYDPGEARPFFHHELFHVYHAQFFTDCDAIWCSLWQEGLAVYASEQLNPGISDKQMALTIPRPIRPEVEANRPRAICAVAALLDSTDHENYRRIFFGSANLEGLPPRVGYYIGYLAAKDSAQTHTLAELAHMNQAQARPVLDAALRDLATCPAG